MKKLSSFVVFLIIAGAVVLWGVKIYNGLVKSDEAVNAAWGQVENVYQRRADLVPNLVATVKGYAQHESSTLEAVVNARSRATQASANDLSEAGVQEFQKAQGELSSALSRLLVVVEQYPDLKANENFKDLQAQLEGTENRIAEARRVFNEEAKSFNAQVRSFPANIVASIFHFSPKGYFTADEAARTAPKVEF
ncbi:MAG: LemA family protein [Bacteroidales bacterium]|nr:LemA family protein [Bacteroidales bacterium]